MTAAQARYGVIVDGAVWRMFTEWTRTMGLKLDEVPTAPSQLPRFTLAGQPREAHVDPTELTAKQLQVLMLAAGGHTNAEIGQRMYLAENTVKTHMAQVFRKIGARDRAHAVAIAYQTGLMGGA